MNKYFVVFAKFAMEKCAGCTKLLPKKEYLRCVYCKSAYDLQCANISSNRYYAFYASDKQRKDNWQCPECQSKMPKTGNANTPIRSTSPIKSPTQSHYQNVTKRVKHCQFAALEEDEDIASNMELSDKIDDKEIITNSIKAELKLFSDEMRAARVAMGVFRETVAELTATIKAQNIRIDQLENKVDILERKLNEPHGCSVSDMEETILKLKKEIQDKDQEMLINDVEIAGFPELKNENASHAVFIVAKKLGVQLEDRDLVSAERVGPPRAFLAGEKAPRPRILAVRLARRQTRDTLLEAARVRRRLSTEDMGLPGATSFFFVNERLTRYNRQLFQRAREAASRVNWKYVWTRGGRIFARREHGKERHRIHTDSDIDKVFGASRVGTPI